MKTDSSPFDITELTPAEAGRLDQIQERVTRFLDRYRQLPEYDLEEDTRGGFSEKEEARAALDKLIILYARGATTLGSVETAARAFVKCCKVHPAPAQVNNRERSAAPPRQHYAQAPRKPVEDLPKSSGQAITEEWREAKALRTVPKNENTLQDGFDRGQLVYVRLCPPNWGAMMARTDGKVYVNIYNPANEGQTTLPEAEADEILSIGDAARDQRAIQTRYAAIFWRSRKKESGQKGR